MPVSAPMVDREDGNTDTGHGFSAAVYGSLALHIGGFAVYAMTVIQEPVPLPAALSVEVVAMSPDPGGHVDGGASTNADTSAGASTAETPASPPPSDEIETRADSALASPSDKAVSNAEDTPTAPATDETAPITAATAVDTESIETASAEITPLPESDRRSEPIDRPPNDDPPPEAKGQGEVDRTSPKQPETAMTFGDTASQSASLSAVGARPEAPGIGDGTYGREKGPHFVIGSAANPMPSYPPTARRRGIEGEVIVSVRVSSEGRALSTRITRSSGSQLLDNAAREAIERWRFKPALRLGNPVESIASVPVVFSLVDP